jgi:hypothetical protein
MDRNVETIATEQTIAVKSKSDSFTNTEQWTIKKKEKANRQ